MKRKECPDRGKALVLYSKIYSCFSPSFTAAATIMAAYYCWACIMLYMQADPQAGPRAFEAGGPDRKQPGPRGHSKLLARPG